MKRSKTCTGCKQNKLAKEFYEDSRNKDRLYSLCKICWSKKSALYRKTKNGKEAIDRAHNKSRIVGSNVYGKGALCRLQKSADKRGLSFSLTAASLERWWMGNKDICSYCHISIEDFQKVRDFIVSYEGSNPQIRKFKRCFKSPKHQSLNRMTIDRADNDVGYELDNMLKACWICNYLKGDFFTSKHWKVIASSVMLDLKKEINSS